jgi:hypothetical protein
MQPKSSRETAADGAQRASPGLSRGVLTMRFAVLLALFAAALLAGAAAAASRLAPFAGLEGAWAGEGEARMADGAVERLTCAATYAVSGGGDHLDQTLACAGAHARFAFSNALDASDGALLGTWRETTRQVEGGLSGRGAADLITLTARGQAFLAELTLAVRGARQSISIRGQGGGFVSAVIEMRRRR